MNRALPERIAKLVTSAHLPRLGVFAERFVELPMDAEWLNEVAALARNRHGALRTLAQRFARLYLSDFDANALTGMYRMLLLPEGAWRRLLGVAGSAGATEGLLEERRSRDTDVERRRVGGGSTELTSAEGSGACRPHQERARTASGKTDRRSSGRLLDVGAGSGDVTALLAPCFAEVETTEVSRGMAKRLAKRGFRCHGVDLSERQLEGAEPFSAVSLLNVLDRCRQPHTLLRRALDLLEPGGRLIVALALPYRPFYFAGPSTPDPEQRLSCDEAVAPSWEDAARRFIERDLLPLGLNLECFARAPYLSAGDSKRPLYELDDVVVVLSKR